MREKALPSGAGNQRLIFIRHGQSITNADRGRLVASNDEDVLTEEGSRQALTTARFLKSLNIENPLIVASPLARAKRTAEIILEEVAPGGGIYYSDRLIEKSAHENYEGVFERYEYFLAEIERDRKSALIIVTHCHWLQVVFGRLLGLDSSETLEFHNCGISVCVSDRVLTVNSFFHLFPQ